MKKFILSIIFSLVCSYSLNATITATIGTVTASPNTVVNIPINVSGVSDANALWGLELHFNYNNTQLSTTGGQITGFTTLMSAAGWFGNINYNSTTIMEAYENGNNFTNITLPDNTVLFVIQATYTGTTSAVLSWDIANSTIFNANGTNLSVNWVNGGVNPAITLAAPVLTAPANNATAVAINPSLTWNSVANANSYRVQISTNSNFSTFVANTIETGTTKALSGLSNNTQYFWRVNAKNGTDSSAWSEVRNFTTTANNIINVPSSWTFTSNTGNNATIGLQLQGTFTIGNRAFQNGDAIGAFYVRDNQKICAGYLIWNGTSFGFVVWGDNDQTTLKDGFAANETYTFKVWDGQLGVEWPAQFTILTGNSFYTVDGMTVLSSLSAITTITQNIPLNSGWDLISSYVNPANLSITNLTSGITNQLVIMKNADGQVYWPPYITSLTNWNTLNGYKINVSAACTLSITGSQIKPETTPIPFANASWYWIPYYRTTSQAIGTALASINGNYTQVKSIGGQVYWPPYLNTLTTLEPNKGYLIYISTASNLTYPANTAPAPSGKVLDNEISFQNPQYLIPEFSNTGNSSTIALDIEGANEGDELGVYTKSGL